jgi:zinc protease
MSDTIIKTTLANGLQVRLKEIHTAPLISHWVWYRVGSRNEITGKTGISHWVEHMQFKGTQQFPAGTLDKAISRDGGMWNAFTYLDWTAFFETMPANKIDLALRLEADRMVNSLYDPQEVESERTVIISEREGSENEPMFRLDEAIQQAAFVNHPYRYEVIGEKEDLHKITRDDLYNHYKNHYGPNNAVLALAGDFDTDEMLAIIQEQYGKLAPAKIPSYSIQPEGVISSEQKIEVSGPGETTYLRVVYRAPDTCSKDFFILSVLDSLMSGPSSLNMFGGGGVSNKTSRLYRALVEKELTVNVSGGLLATIDPYLYGLTMTVHPNQSPQAVLEAYDVEIARLQDHKVSPEEISRAVKQARALFAYGTENITNQAFWMGYAEMFANYDWFTNYVTELEKVTPEDIQKAAQTILQPNHRVIGVYLPTGNGGDGE